MSTDGRNPIVPGFHPDPTVCRVGDEFYLAASSFTYMPGVPIFRSRNLIDWEQVGNALDRRSQFDLTMAASSSAGIYAPTLRHHRGRFWLMTTSVTDSGLYNFIVTADEHDTALPRPGPRNVLGAGRVGGWLAGGRTGRTRVPASELASRAADEPDRT
jgi:xylan 1,4-beta-xylosidase